MQGVVEKDNHGVVEEFRTWAVMIPFELDNILITSVFLKEVLSMVG